MTLRMVVEFLVILDLRKVSDVTKNEVNCGCI